jgi:hypothetical protein
MMILSTNNLLYCEQGMLKRIIFNILIIFISLYQFALNAREIALFFQLLCVILQCFK